jgi:hypothetical protein
VLAYQLDSAPSYSLDDLALRTSLPFPLVQHLIQAQFVGPAGLFELDHGFSCTIPCTILKLRVSQRDRYARQKKTALRGAHPARHPLPVQGPGEWPVPIARGIEYGTEDAARQDEGLPESQAVPGSPLPRGV